MKYRLTIYPAIEAGNPSTSFLFESKLEMEAAHHTSASLLIFIQDQAKVMDDYSNVFCCEERIGHDWMEIDEHE